MQQAIAQKFDTNKLVKFVLPSVVMMLFVSIYSMMGSIFSAKYINEYALSAVNIVFPFISLVLAVAIMFSTGANAILSANLGEDNAEMARDNFTVITILSVLTGIIFTILGRTFDDEIIRFLGASESIAIYAKPYLRTYSFIFPFMFVGISAQYYFVTVGKSLMGLLITIISGSLNILTSYLLIGVFQIGVIGAAIGSSLAYVIPTICYFIYFSNNKNPMLYFVKPKLHKGFIFNTCANGSSEMVTNLAIAIVSALMNIIMSGIAGDNGVAAVSVIVQVQFLLSSMYIGFGAGIAPIFGFAYGANNHAQTKTVFKISIRLVAVSSAILVLICMLLNKFIVSAFISPQSSSYELANTGFIIFSLGYCFAGLNIFTSVFFTAVSNGKISALISFLRTFAFILGMLAILPNFLGATGVWLAIPIAEALALIVSIVLLKKHRKIYKY